MDILGYQQMTITAQRQNQQETFLQDLYAALAESRQWLDNSFSEDSPQILEKDFYALKAFTDNIVVGFPIRRDGEIELGDALDRSASFQFNMAIKGFFVKGSIAVGDIYMDDIAVVGDALIEAYQAESSLARDPRVILTPSAKSLINHHIGYYSSPDHAPQTREVLVDSDGQWFVNYLDQVMIAGDEHGPFYKEFGLHKEAVEMRLAQHKDNPPVFAKYAWVAAYHNYFCDLHSGKFENKHKIDTELFRARPKRITE